MDVKNVKNVLRKEKHMNKTSKLLSLLLVLAIVFSLSVTALAADTTYTITVNGSGTVANHTFEAYQIFKGDLHAPETNEGGNTSKILSNIVWGTGVNTNAEGFAEAFPESAAATAEKLLTVADAQAFAKKIAPFLSDVHTDCSTKDGSGNYVISGLSAGYYLVKDKDDSAPSSDAYTRYILQVVHNVTVNAKTDVPTVDKNIKEGDTSVKANNASIGDVINYEVKSAVPDMTGYTKYFFVLNDTMSKGLTFNNDVAVTIGGTTLGANKYTVAYNTDTTGITTIEIVIKNFINYTKGDAILVTYSATLNQDASLDPVAGNPNKVQLTYSNNPNVDGKGDPKNPDKPGEGAPTGKTPESETKTYVTGIKLTKVDGQNKNQTLTGAKFEIKGEGMKVVLVNKEMYKKSASGTYELCRGFFAIFRSQHTTLMQAPARYARTFSIAVCCSRRRHSSAAQLMCGVMTQFLAESSGLSMAMGSVSMASSPAPAILPLFSASARS